MTRDWSRQLECDGEFVVTVILLLSDGDPQDSLSNITQAIFDGNQLVGTKVTILSFGMNTSTLSSHMKFISSYYSVYVSCSILI